MPIKQTWAVILLGFSVFTLIFFCTCTSIVVKPAEFKINKVEVSPQEVTPSQKITISAEIGNVGDISDNYTVILNIDGKERDRQVVTVKPSKNKTAVFSIIESGIGLHEVMIGSVKGSFTVYEILTLGHDNDKCSYSWMMNEPWGQWIRFDTQNTPFKIRKVSVMGKRSNSTNSDNKTYTIKIWNGDFVNQIYTHDYPYLNFSTKIGMVDHEINPPIEVKGGFAIELISHSEWNRYHDTNDARIYVCTDFTVESSQYIGCSKNGMNDESTYRNQIQLEPRFSKATWIIRVEGVKKSYANAVLPEKEAKVTQSDFAISNLNLSSNSAIEGDNILATIKATNTGNQSVQWKSAFYVDKNLVKADDIQVEPKSSRESSYTITENSTCMRYIENGGQGQLIVFHPIGNPGSINRTSFIDYTFTQPNVVGVLLKENINAKNTTYLQVIDFLKSKDYSRIPSGPQTMHNDAEAAGIRCAFVWWEAEITDSTTSVGGIAGSQTTRYVSNAALLDAFLTVDRGLVFVDANSPGYIAYVEKAKNVGYIDFDNALYADYSYFEKYSSMVNSETDRIKKLFPNVSPGFPTYKKANLTTGKCDLYW